MLHIKYKSFGQLLPEKIFKDVFLLYLAGNLDSLNILEIKKKNYISAQLSALYTILYVCMYVTIYKMNKICLNQIKETLYEIWS